MFGISKIFHGGSGGRGSSTGYGASLVTKIFDELGHLLVEGAGWLLHLRSTDVQADSDINALVVNDLNLTVGNNSSKSVAGNDSSSIGGDISETIGGNKSKLVTGDDDATIGGNKSETITGNCGATVGGDWNSSVDGDASISCNSSISINSTGNGITISSDNDASPFGNTQIFGREITILSNSVTSGGIILFPGNGSIHIYNLKSGVSQAAAGAAAGEIWHNTATHVLMMGV